MKNIGISKGIMVMNLLYLDNYLVFADASENNKWKQNLRFEELQRLTQPRYTYNQFQNWLGHLQFIHN